MKTNVMFEMAHRDSEGKDRERKSDNFMRHGIVKGMIFAMLIAIALLCGCGGSDSGKSEAESENSGKPKVVTTLFAPYDFVRQIAGEDVEITMLLSPGEESHSYDPTPQDIIKIQECDLFIYNGGENDTWVDNVLSSLSEDVNVLSMTSCVGELYEEEIVEGMQAGASAHDHSHEEHTEDAHTEEEHTEEEHAEDAHGEYDEHVWASPANAISITKAIAEQLKKIDSANASEYEKRCTEYTEKLQGIDDEIKEVVGNAKRKLVIFGDRFPLRYFVEEFGLDYYAAFPGCSADTEADSSTIAFLIDKVKSESIPIIFKAELSNGNIAETISEATGAEVKTFYACHNVSKDDFDTGISYADMMQSNADVLKEALN